MNATAPHAMRPEHLRQRAELLLERRPRARDRGQHRRDLAHLRLHAGRRHDHRRRCRASPPCSGTACSSGRRARPPSPASTPASFATGALSPVSAASCVSSVAERRIRPSAGTMSPASTCDDVARHDVDGRHEGDRAVAHDLRLRHLQVRERVDARARLQLLARAEHDVEEDQQRDDDAGRDLADHEAHGDDRDQHDVHRVAQLLRCHRPDRRRLLALDLVRAVPRETCRRLRARQAGRASDSIAATTSAGSRAYGGSGCPSDTVTRCATRASSRSR